MSRTSRTDQPADRVRQAAAQLQPAAAKVKPLAGSTGAAASAECTECAPGRHRESSTQSRPGRQCRTEGSALLSSVAQLRALWNLDITPGVDGVFKEISASYTGPVTVTRT